MIHYITAPNVDGTLTRLNFNLGRCLAQLVARATHVPRFCSGPGFDSRPGSPCCVSLPLSHPVSCRRHHVAAVFT